MCTPVNIAEKREYPCVEVLCSRVAAGDIVRETLITCNEIPEITL